MASYHCSVKVGGKGKASGHAAYIAREGYYAERDGYEDLEATGYGNMPAWAEHEPALFWSAADRHERANGATYREIEIALPRELNPTQRQELILDFIQHEIGERHAHQWAIHNPGAALAGGEQPHAHLMYSERTLDGINRDPERYFKRYNGKHPDLGGCRKDSAGTEERLLETRQRWAEIQNAHLQQHGHAARVDHRSLADQDIDREPEQHLGGRRVRQLEPEQREALLERREAEDELRQSQRELAPLDLAQHLHELTAAAERREQAEQAARMAEARAYCRQALNEFRAELAQKAERERALEAERERLQRREAEQERPQRPEAEHAPLLEPLPAIGISSPSFAERLQAALAETMEQLQAQREQAQEPPQRSRGFDLEP
ncbi:MAG: MobA/MobL family protein [Nitrospira sp.]|nr:MobA/MobL family protein [Nitrospira sp.]